ncbi:septum site-determining protein MinC [Oscillatoria sp. FACHB-1406]|uniref:septum site-determining protein MinC n=1 Tax=Oscillatoria sp. FACHB-1406 TaxID=2692846 RepID=UPI001686AABF|nr:septum site-determining protein MinC [Oscillatoria sp. FACHB-1406]MBD2577717.1 septum site-determining protein MinC [Oscillatoria sp. FACHB-1406]
MTDSAEPASLPDIPIALLTDADAQVRLTANNEQLQLLLPNSESKAVGDWLEILDRLKQRLNSGERFWQPGASVTLIARDRLLDARQLQSLAQALTEVELKIDCVQTNRRQTAVAAATAGYSVEQQPPDTPLLTPGTSSNKDLSEPPLYLQSTLRSGVEIRHPGTVVIFGDVNPGCIIIASGDIFVWGRLLGIAHAGAEGQRDRRIIALQMEATQLRIADILARVPEQSPEHFYPEVAYITADGIRLTKAVNFAKSYIFDSVAGVWIDAIANSR